MVDSRYRYAHEKLGAAISALMIPVTGVGPAVTGAMREYSLAFGKGEWDPDVQRYVDRINRIMDTDGSWDDRANGLDELELHDLVEAFWGLDRTVSRLYYEG